MKIFMHLLVALSFFVRQANASAVRCTWGGRKRTHGAKSNDDYVLDCNNNKLTGVYATINFNGPILGPSPDGSVACNWQGPRKFHGAKSCDDFHLECYEFKLHTITKVDTCGGAKFQRPGSSAGPVCNFVDRLKFHGVKSGDDFELNCDEGELDSIGFRGRRRLGQSRQEEEASDLTGN